MSDRALKYALRDVVGACQAVVGEAKSHCAVVQAGGHAGTFPAHLSGEFGTVYTFEPSPTLFRRLVERCSSLDNVVPMNAALGYHRGLVSAVQERRDGNREREWHSGVTHVVPGGHIPTFRIDDLQLTTCDAIMLDVEGYELFALQGAEETIARCRPVICVELNDGGATLGIRDEDVRTWLRCVGYEHATSYRSDETWKPR